MNMTSPPQLKLYPIVVVLHWHFGVFTHDYFVEKLLDSIVEIQSSSEHVFADELIFTLIFITLDELIQSKDIPILVGYQADLQAIDNLVSKLILLEEDCKIFIPPHIST